MDARHPPSIRVRRLMLITGMVVMAMIATVAIYSPIAPAIHPDESYHVAAYRYFAEHILPPAVDDPAISPTISGYGFSYLFELDLVYMISAHITSPFRWILRHPTEAARLFNVALFASIMALAWRRPRSWPVFGVLLLSPQIWYVFSYFNADALPLTLGTILAAMIALPDGAVSRYLRGNGRELLPLATFAALLAVLLLSKRNYLPLVAGIILWLIVTHVGIGWRALCAALTSLTLLVLAVFAGDVPGWNGTAIPLTLAISGVTTGMVALTLLVTPAWRDPARRPVMLRLAALLLVAAAATMPRLGWDLAMNGSPGTRSETISRIMEERAAPAFKPSAVAAGTGYEGRGLAARGITLRQVLFEPYHWFLLSAQSAFGVYGYLNVFAPGWLYGALMLALATFVAASAIGAVRAEPTTGGKLILLVAAIASIVLLISIMHSWTFDLQRQGRYLFPIMPLLGLLAARGYPQAPRGLYGGAAIAGTLLGMYSFGAYALPLALS